MAKPSWYRLFGRDSQFDHAQFRIALEDSGLADHGIGARFFQLFAARAEAPAASDAAQAAASAIGRSAVLRSPELAAIAIPASAALDQRIHLDLAAASGVTVPAPEALPTNEAGTGRAAVVQYSPAPGVSSGGLLGGSAGTNIVVLMSDNLSPVGLMDTHGKQLLQGGPGDHPELGAGPDDILEISGDFSGGFLLSPMVPGLDTIVFRAGNNYNFIASDDLVAPGATLAISAMPLGAGDHMLFDGSAETDGRFIFYGSEGTDLFLGGAGDDRIYGLGGGDLLNGGGGSDTFSYTFASESSGADYDTLGDFDIGVDRIDLPGTVTGFGAAIESGSISQATFSADLSALLGGLGAGQAMWVAPDAGDLAGTIFLIVDGNGVAGYQEGEDYVFAIGGSPLEDLTGGGGGFFV